MAVRPESTWQIATDVPEGWESPVIAMNDAVDVLRHGWQDAAGIFAPDSPEIAELLQARLEMAVANRALDETHLLGAIDDVESMAESTGSPSGQALARRLRRTVYEYLLALDAAPPPVLAAPGPAPAPAEPPVTPEPQPEVEEVAALGHRTTTADALAAAPTDDAGAHADDEVEANGESQARRSRLGLRRSQGDTQTGDEAAAELDAEADAAGPLEAAEPTWQYQPTTTSGQPDPLASPQTEAQAQAQDQAEPQVEPEPEIAPEPGAQAQAQPEPEVAPAPAEPEGVAPTAEVADPQAAEHADGFVAPRPGFHIVEETHPNHAPGAAAESPLPMPAFEVREATAAPPAAAGEFAGADEQTYQWTRPAAASPPPAPAPATAPAPDVPRPAPFAEPVAATPEHHADGDTEIDKENGWRVRVGTNTGANAPPQIEEDPFENNPHLAELRRRIDERLRRKKCDEAAALMQELAQEAGGRIVAELAMNAGDRCQSLGKSNAALNCYLAGSRADPVYELPLSRLADICIDDQDTELAVSYLERIARLYRFRGDDKAALRVYRRIATIAPYREDVLTLLLNVQNTGRFDS
jgi:hypothetical protein